MSATVRLAPIKIELEVTCQTIADMMVTAIEGGSSYWCASIDLVKPYKIQLKESPWYSDPELYSGEWDYEIKVKTHEDGPAKFKITPERMRAGLSLMASKDPRHFGDMQKGDFDAYTGDVFLQFICLGEVVYG